MTSVMQKIISILLTIISVINGSFGVVNASAPDDAQGAWLLTDVVPFDGGYYSSALFNTGTGLDQEMPTIAQPEPDPTYSYMQLVRGTTLADVEGYCEKLRNAGYDAVFENQIENNYYYAYENGDRLIYFFYNDASGETRIIDDCCNTAALNEFSYTTDLSQIDGEPLQPTVYQFSYPYKDTAHPDTELYADNGMLYVILLSDGKVILIDGGSKKQGSEQNIEEFWKFLHTITGKKKNEKIDIAMWYGTHIHGDHNAFFYKLLRRHYKKINLERVMFNFQADEVIPTSAYGKRLRHIITNHYPDVQYIKDRSGYAFQLQDALCEVIYTQEDFVDAETASWVATNPNDASSVLRITLGGKTFLFLGDSYYIVEDRLLQKYTAETLHVDVLQAAHHLYNDLTQLYPVIQPTYVMCPQSGLRAKTQPMAAYLTLREIVPAENFFFPNENIVYGFTPQSDGTITISELAVDCGPYDGSTLN